MDAIDAKVLISAVFIRKPLWDQRHSKHHNNNVLNKLWTEVAKLVKTDKATVKTKWKNLRDTFRRERRKVSHPKPGYTDGNSFEPSWAYYKSLLFLKDQFGLRRKCGKMEVGESELEDQYTPADDEPKTSINTSQNEITPPSTSPTPSSSRDLNPILQPKVTLTKICGQDDTIGMEEQTSCVDENKLFVKSALPRIKILSSERINTSQNEARPSTSPTPSSSRDLNPIVQPKVILTKRRYKRRRQNDTIAMKEQTSCVDENKLFLDGLLPHIKNLPSERINTSQNEPLTSTSPTPSSLARSRLKRCRQNDTIELEEQTSCVDENELFFKSLLPHLKNLPSERKLALRMEIQKLVYNFAYGGVTKTK